MSRLPGILGVIADLAGNAAAERLALQCGGTEMKFSDRPKAQLARVVGVEAARRIVAELGREKYTIPMAHLRGQKGRRRQAAEMLANGASHNDVARTCDVHERTARRVTEALKKSRTDGLPLFPDE